MLGSLFNVRRIFLFISCELYFKPELSIAVRNQIAQFGHRDLLSLNKSLPTTPNLRPLAMSMHCTVSWASSPQLLKYGLQTIWLTDWEAGPFHRAL